MPLRYNILLKNATVVDPVNDRNAVMDVGIADGKVAEIAVDMNPDAAREWIDLSGFYLIPGIIDLHVHVSSWLGGRYGHKMMALAGVTTALDMSGPVDSVVEIAAAYGVGLNLACLQYVRPGYTVKTTDPDRPEIEKLLHDSMAKGEIGKYLPLSGFKIDQLSCRRIELCHIIELQAVGGACLDNLV